MPPSNPKAERDRQNTPPAAELQLGKELLVKICGLVMATTAAMAAMMTLSGVFELRRFIGQLLLGGIALIGLLLARSGRPQISSAFMAWGFLATITYFSAISGGHLSPATMGYFVVIAAAGWFHGRSTTIALTLAAAVVLGGLAYAEAAGWLPRPAPSNPLFRWFTQAIIFILGAMLVLAASRAMAIRLWELERARLDLSQALSDISEHEAQLITIANNVPAMIFYGDRDMRCRWANQAYAEFTGFTTDTIIGRHVRDIIGEPLFAAVKPNLERVLAGERMRYEGTRLSAAGEPRQMEIELVPDRSQGSQVLGWFGLMRDITERRRREQLLPSLVKGTARTIGDAFFASLVSQIGPALGTAFAMIAETAGAGTQARSLAFWSADGFLANVHYDLAGTPCQDVLQHGSAFFPTGAAQRFPADRPLAARGIEGYYGIALRDSRGEPIGLLVVMHTAALRLDPEQMATMEIFASRAAVELERLHMENSLRESNVLLEQRVEERTAQLAAANRELEAFSYSVSHDLRAPLRHIGGYARMLAEEYADRLDAEGGNYLRRIQRSVQHLDNLITDLLELSRVGHVKLKREPVDLSHLANDIASELAHAHADRRIEWHISDGMVARADGRLVRILLHNLIGNAWKYTGRQAWPRIDIGPGDDGAFFVRDNGAGFDPKFAAKLFRPFQRLHGASEFEGTGIGLATVARIVERHGGRIWAEAAVGQGATFHFTLPAPAAPSCGD